MEIVKYNKKYVKEAMSIWNNIIEDGIYFPQIDILKDTKEADKYFSSQVSWSHRYCTFTCYNIFDSLFDCNIT